jgi:hypothetical protein
MAVKMFRGTASFAGLDFFKPFSDGYSVRVFSFRNSASPSWVIFPFACGKLLSAFCRAIFSGATVPLSSLKGRATPHAGKLNKRLLFLGFNNPRAFLRTRCGISSYVGRISRKGFAAPGAKHSDFASGLISSKLIFTAHCIQYYMFDIVSQSPSRLRPH